MKTRNTPTPVILAMLVAACGGPSRPASGPAAELEGPLPTDTLVVRGELDNGLEYFIRRNAEPPNRAELRLVVRAGSILEDDDQRGLAHVVEHMAFNGTRNFEEQELVDYLEGVGMRFGPDVNAYTSFDETVYMLTLPTDSAGVLETGFQILEDWASGVAFDSVEVEKERGVVIEEWRLGQGAGSRLQRKQFPALMRGSRYAERLPIGTLESLQEFKQEDLRRFYRDWYRPELMAVVAVGDFDLERVEGLIREHFGGLRNLEDSPERREFDVPPHEETVVSVATDPEATASNVSLYLKSEPTPWVSVGRFRQWLVESLASGVLTNRLTERIHRPESPFLDVSSYQGRFTLPLAVFMLNARVPEDGIERGLEELLLEVERVDQHGFTQTELEREKKDLLRRLEQRYVEREKATSGGFASEYVSHFVYGGTIMSIEDEFELARRLIPTIGVDEAEAALRRWVRPQNRVILVTAPEKEGVRVPAEQALHEVIRSVRDRDVLAYTDSLSDAPLLPVEPVPGSIVQEHVLEDVGVTEWTLSNGVRVLLKPTDFKADEVLFAGHSPGGTSLLSDEDLFAGQTAAAVVQAGGLGALSTIDLRKRLAGKTVGVGASISELSESLSGGTSPQDLEALFQLVYLKFTAPRWDSAAAELYRSQAIAALRNRRANPEQVFMDSMRVILAQNHPRVRPSSPEDFARLDTRRAFEIYRDRFADAGDFTFYMAGNFDLEGVRPLVERYLGGLPSTGREEKGRDLGIRPPRGVVDREVRKGLEEKALTQLVFTGPLEFSREELLRLNVLGEVLQLRLRERLREDLGGTYGVRVGAGGSNEPWSRYQISIGFGADPARVDELTRVVFDEIDALRSEGPTAEELAKVKEMEVRARETEVRSNHFWISYMMSYDRQDWPLELIERYPEWLDELTAATIRQTARAYLNPQNYVQVSLLPQAGEAAPRQVGAGMELP